MGGRWFGRATTESKVNRRKTPGNLELLDVWGKLVTSGEEIGVKMSRGL